MVTVPEEGHCPCLETQEGRSQGDPTAWELCEHRGHQHRAQPQPKAPLLLQPYVEEEEGSNLHCGTQHSAQPLSGDFPAHAQADHHCLLHCTSLFGPLRTEARKPQHVLRLSRTTPTREGSLGSSFMAPSGITASAVRPREPVPCFRIRPWHCLPDLP